jgi:hypothetical protein
MKTAITFVGIPRPEKARFNAVVRIRRKPTYGSYRDQEKPNCPLQHLTKATVNHEMYHVQGE